MKLTILGAPGAGKGTQALKLASKLSIAHISTGELLRKFIRSKLSESNINDTDIAHEIDIIMAHELNEQMRRGDLAPDLLIFELLKKRLAQADCASGFILDGFPRNLAQAMMFGEQGYEFDAVVAIIVEDAVIIDRLTGRRTCVGCGRVYHLQNNPSKVSGVCDSCNAELIQRSDDNEKTVSNRLKIYHNVTKPIIEFYKEHGLLREINGEDPVEKISEAIIAAVIKN